MNHARQVEMKKRNHRSRMWPFSQRKASSSQSISPLAVRDDNYCVVGQFSNDTDGEMRMFLEMTCEEIFFEPGHSVELLAKKSDALLPITVAYIADGLQIFANREFDVDWHIRFKGRIFKPGFPTRLAELDIDPESGNAV